MSVTLSTASRSTSKATLKMIRQMTMDASGSHTPQPSMAPPMPARAPTDDSASER